MNQVKMTNAVTGEVSSLAINSSLNIGDNFRLIGRTTQFKVIRIGQVIGQQVVTGISSCGKFRTTARTVDTAKA